MTWPEWSRERLISLAFAGIYFRDGRSSRNILSYTASWLDARNGIRFRLSYAFLSILKTQAWRTQALRASGGCVPGRRIPAQRAGKLRDGEHRAGPAAGVRGQRGTGGLLGAEKHWFAHAKRGSLCTELTDLIAEFCGIARDRIFLVMVDIPDRCNNLSATFEDGVLLSLPRLCDLFCKNCGRS